MSISADGTEEMIGWTAQVVGFAGARLTLSPTCTTAAVDPNSTYRREEIASAGSVSARPATARKTGLRSKWPTISRTLASTKPRLRSNGLCGRSWKHPVPEVKPGRGRARQTDLMHTATGAQGEGPIRRAVLFAILLSFCGSCFGDCSAPKAVLTSRNVERRLVMRLWFSVIHSPGRD